MEDYNEFSWTEKSGDDEPLYTETVSDKPKKKKRKKVIALVVAGVILVGTISSVATGALYKNGVFRPSSTVKIYRGQAGGSGVSVEYTSNDENANKKELSVEEIAKTVGPAVVGITCKINYTSFFGTQQGKSSGSGIIMNEDGYIVTNYHVVDGAESVNVKLNTGEEYMARYIGGDSQTDIAVIKIEDNENLCVGVFGDSDSVEVGSLAVVIGNPLGDELFGTVTSGIISGVNRTIQVDDRDMVLLQTDAAINSGNSGGALINKYGEVIGIPSVKLVADSSEGLGFAIPSNTVQTIIADIISYGYVKGRPLIGITTRELTREIAYYNNLPVEKGLYIMSVSEGSAAELAGLTRGDIIIKFNGEEVSTSKEINEKRDQFKAGDTITLTIIRDGKEKNVSLTLGENKPDMGL